MKQARKATKHHDGTVKTKLVSDSIQECTSRDNKVESSGIIHEASVTIYNEQSKTRC